MIKDNITGNGIEVDELTEITDVTFENNRLVLRVSDPIKARKFGLSDNTYRYEFDGGSMYWYKDEDESKPHSWSCSCGKGGYTCVDTSTSTQIRTVKKEMAKQIELKDMRSYFGNKKEFTNVAIEVGDYYYDSDGSLKPRCR